MAETLKAKPLSSPLANRNPSLLLTSPMQLQARFSPRPCAQQARKPQRWTRVCSTSYTAPSNATAANELEALSLASTVILDSVNVEGTHVGGAAVTFGLLRRISTSEALGLKPLENAITTARTFSKDPEVQVEKAMANVGAILASSVQGRVTTEVDPRYAQDSAKLVSKAKSIAALYKELGVPKARLLWRLPATWAGVQASKELEAAGLATSLYMVYSLTQGIAGAQAGASIVNANVGRTRDFYNRNPGLIRDPKGPRQDAGLGSSVDPGVLLVTQLYNYVKVHHAKTKVMATGIRTREDALALAGCDLLVLPPKVASELSATPTVAGYNDGLHAAGAAAEDAGINVNLSPALAAEEAPAKVPQITEALFKEGLGVAGSQLLEAALKDALDDVNALAGLARATTGLSSS